MLRLIQILSGITAFLLAYGIYLVLTEKKRMIDRRLREVTTGVVKNDGASDIERDQVVRGKGVLRLLGSLFAPQKLRTIVGEELLKADILLRAEEFIAIILLSFLGGGVLGYVFNGLGAAIVFALFGLILPMLYLNAHKQKRMNKLNSQMVDCLSVMTNSLRAGFSFLQTMDQVGKELPPPLGIEFARTTREIGLGLTVEEALQNMARRLESEDLDLMVTAVLIQRQIGGNLAEILDNISHTIRERIRIKGEIRTLTAQARTSGWIIGVLPIGMFALLTALNPEYMSSFFTTKLGWLLMAGGVLSELIGVLIISRIVRIEL